MWAKTTTGVDTEIAEAASFEINNIDEADEVHAVGVKAVPAGADGGTAVALAIDFSLIRINQVVFAGHVVHIEARLRDDVISVVEFLFLRQMTDVAGMDHKGWLLQQGIDLGDRLFQCPKRVRISWFIEADMAVADLQERQATGFRRLRLAHDAE